MKKDYYEILGVAKGASIPDIKKAYRTVTPQGRCNVVFEGIKKEDRGFPRSGS